MQLHVCAKRPRVPPKGLAAVEFALILPLLLLLLFGIINFGILMYDQAVVTNAAREGARWAAVRTSATFGGGCTMLAAPGPNVAPNPCQVAFDYAKDRLINFNAQQLPTVSYSAANGVALGSAQTVTVSYTYRGIGWFFGSQQPATYSATAVMLHE